MEFSEVKIRGEEPPIKTGHGCPVEAGGDSDDEGNSSAALLGNNTERGNVAAPLDEEQSAERKKVGKIKGNQSARAKVGGKAWSN